MSISKTLRFTILARDGFECVYCHSTDKPLHVDHIRPKAMGGNNNAENLVTACEDCNSGKSASSLNRLHTVPRPDFSMGDADERGKLPKDMQLKAKDERIKELLYAIKLLREAKNLQARLIEEQDKVIEGKDQLIYRLEHTSLRLVGDEPELDAS